MTLIKRQGVACANMCCNCFEFTQFSLEFVIKSTERELHTVQVKASYFKQVSQNKQSLFRKFGIGRRLLCRYQTLSALRLHSWKYM